MESLAQLTVAQQIALDRLTPFIKIDQIDQILTQGPEALNARFEAFIRYETTLIGQVHDHVASTWPTRYIVVSE